MQDIVLPRGYLSYSAMELWLRDKEGYRLRYYVGEDYFSTPYTEFGNKVGEALEFRQWEDPVLAPVRGKIPQGTHPEHKLEVVINGVTMFGKLDDFDLQNYAIEEYKTGIRDAKGKAPWNKVAVRKHKQLTLYSLFVRTKYGIYNPNIRLTWMETAWGQVCKDITFGSKVIQDCNKNLYLTGHVETFWREIKDWELDRMAEIIRKTAEDITEDYKQWQQKKPQPKKLPALPS